MEVSPNICYRNAFARQLETHWYTEIHCESIGSFKDESCTIGYISHLNWNWIAQNRAGFSMVLNYMSNSNFSEVANLAPKVGSVILHAHELI